MTPEEAIKTITQMLNEFCNEDSYAPECKDAVNMAISALEAQDVPDTNVGDPISRSDAIDIINVFAERFNRYIGTPNDSEVYAYARGLLLSIESDIRALPSAESKQLQVLADVLDGCPLTQPCDKMWRGGWCEEHCKNNKLQEPNAECWLKYAEVMASEQ